MHEHKPPQNPMPNSGDAHTAPPSNKSLVTAHGAVDTSGVPSVDETGLPSSRIVGHEQYEVGLRGAFHAMVWFVIVLIVTFVVVYITMFGFKNAELASELPKTGVKESQINPLPPEPRLQPSRGHETMEWEDQAQMKGQMHDRLTTYGWVDEQAKVAHIPIEKAMEQALKDPKALPARAGGERPSR